MKVRKIIFACFNRMGFSNVFVVEIQSKNNRAYLENRIGTEVSRVYPTQKLEDLFEQFPNGFIVYQVRQVNENNVKIKLTGTEKGAPIKGELIETERKSGEDTRVVSVELLQLGSILFQMKKRLANFGRNNPSYSRKSR